MAFTYPFRYTPSPEIREAARRLMARLDADPHNPFREGKMMGVLTAAGPDGTEHTLYSFSGLANGCAHIDGFVPPVFDWSAPGGYFRRREAQISAMPAGMLRSKASADLQDYLFRQYIVMNALGEEKSVKEIFAARGLVPPGGTGECAAPKLLCEAYRRGLRPLAMGEFWYGAPHRSEVREQGRFYPSCTGKCGPLLDYMMQGLEVDENPLDRRYTALYEPRIIFADEEIIVADKPAGMLSVPGRTAAESLLGRLGGEFGEVHSCHRLDMDTSGVMVFARSLQAKTEIERQFSGREVSKTYRARLSAGGHFRHRLSGTIALPLSSDYYDRPRQTVDFERGKPAITEYRVLEILPDGGIEVLFTPKTGRTHQLRVHAAHTLGLGRPIKGDRLYGSPDGGRLCLHAETISFRHPRSGEMLTFKA